MLESLYRQKVRIMRLEAGSSSGDGAGTYAELLDGIPSSLAPVPLRCKLDEVGSRGVTQQGAEQRYDATMLFVVQALPNLLLHDIVVTEDGRKFRVERIESTRPVGSRKTYGNAKLNRTTTAVPEVKSLGE